MIVFVTVNNWTTWPLFLQKNPMNDIDEGSSDIAKDVEDVEYEGM